MQEESRRWLLASMGASVVGAAAGAIEAATPTPTPKCAGSGDPEKFECEVPLGTMELPPVQERANRLLEKLKMGVQFRSPGKILGAKAEELLHAAYDGATWGDFDAKQPNWCLVVVQAHVLGQLAAYFAKSTEVTPKNLLRAWGLFGHAMSSAGMPHYVDHRAAHKDSKKAFKLPWMPNYPGGVRCWTPPKGVLEADQGCELCYA